MAISKSLGRSSQITLLTVCLLGGIVAGRNGLSVSGWWAIAGFGLWAANMGRRTSFAVLMLAMIVFGVWRGYNTAPSNTLLGSYFGQKVALRGVISDDPGRNEKGQTQFILGSIKINEGSVPQSVKITAIRTGLQRGYHVRAQGKLAPARGAIPFSMSFADIQVESTNIGWLERFRARFFAASHTALPDPMSGFGLGLLVGVRSLISKDLQDTLSTVGLSHLVAVSGYNLTIIVMAVQKLTSRVSLFISTALSLWLVFGFLLVAGFSASIMRAALVALIALWLGFYGLRPQSMTLISLPAAITAGWNPEYVVSDLGWQLSFLAFFGVLVIAPIVEQRWFPEPNAITSLTIESTAAHVITLPLIMYRFEVLSVIAPISNLIILPLVPLAMLGAFLVGMASTISFIVGAWLALPVGGMLALMIGISQWFARWPFASIKLSINGPQTVLMYGLIILVVILIRGRRSPFVRLP